MKLYNLAFLMLFCFPFLPSGNTVENADTQSKELHKYYVGKCLIDYNQEEQALQVSLFMFLDDLEAALRAQGADKLFLCTEQEAENAELYLERYLQQHLKFHINDTLRPYVFIGKESSEDFMGVWCYVEVTEVVDMQKLKFRNDVLMEIYDEQKNVVIFRGPDNKEASYLFQKGEAEATLNF